MSEFRHLDDDHDVRTEIVAAFEREWHSLQLPGSFLSSNSKLRIATAVRAVRRDQPIDAGLPPMVAEVVARLTRDPASVRRQWVERVLASGLSAAEYVEIVGLVSRVVAVDAWHHVGGIHLPPLPAPGAGEPSGHVDPKAVPSKAFVPMTRGTSIWWSLTLIPEAYERMEDLHGALYLSPEQMRSPDGPWALTRPQMELIAARASVVNECFY